MPATAVIALCSVFAMQAAPAGPAPRAEPGAPTGVPSVAPSVERPSEPAPPQVPSAMPPVPATPGAPVEVVACQPFTLRAPYAHRCRREGGDVRAGHLVVVRAAAGYIVPRQVAEPVACFGSQTGERLWSSSDRGLAIYLVPAWDGRMRRAAPATRWSTPCSSGRPNSPSGSMPHGSPPSAPAPRPRSPAAPWRPPRGRPPR